MKLGVRKGDITIHVRQDNSARDIIVEAIDEPHTKLYNVLGYKVDEWVGASLKSFMPERIRNLVEEYVEYIEEGNDLAHVMMRVRNFSLLDKFGNNIDLKLRIVPELTQDNNPRYAVIMRDDTKVGGGVIVALREFKGKEAHDPVTNLLSGDSFRAKSDIVHSYASRGLINSTLALIQLDRFQSFLNSHGLSAWDNLLIDIASLIRKSLREEDVLGYLGTGCFGVTLVEADIDNAKVPLNRLRWQVNNQPLFIGQGEEGKVSLSIAYREFNESETVLQTIEKCKKSLEHASVSRNQLIAL